MPATHLIRVAAIGFVYFAAASLSILTSRHDGGVALLWCASAVSVPALRVTRRGERFSLYIAIAIASAAATTIFGLGPLAALPLAVAALLEAFVGVELIERLAGRDRMMRSLRWLVVFLFAGGIASPAAGALVAGLFNSWLLDRPFLGLALQWYFGHALGLLAFAPLVALMLRGRMWSWWWGLSSLRRLEIMAMIGGVVACSFAVFDQRAYPLLFLPLLPAILVTFRGGIFGAALAILAIALVGTILTMGGHGPVAAIEASAGVRTQFLQFYLAATVLTIWPIASELSRRDAVFRPLREREARYRLITERSSDTLLTLKLDGTILFASASSLKLGAMTADSLIGMVALDLVHPADREAAAEAHRAAILEPGSSHRIEYRLASEDGMGRWLESNATAYTDEEGNPIGVVNVVRDVSERKRHELRLVDDANTDPLTCLPNRRAFMAQLETIGASANGAGFGCIAMIDLDHFKAINDQYGHQGGDAVLAHFAGLLRSNLRAGDVAARLGGEEFAIVLPHANIGQALGVCDRIRQAASGSNIAFGGETIQVTASIGLASWTGGSSPFVALNQADTALYTAKRDGRDCARMAA